MGGLVLLARDYDAGRAERALYRLGDISLLSSRWREYLGSGESSLRDGSREEVFVVHNAGELLVKNRHGKHHMGMMFYLIKCVI